MYNLLSTCIQTLYKYQYTNSLFVEYINYCNIIVLILFKGVGTNILCAITNAGVLASYDKLQFIVFSKKCGSGGT